MATYKLIQDIEAEDKILGPLTLRQFIFGLITAFLGYICFICIAKGVAFLDVLFLPPAILTGFFAFPFGRDQPTEVWALGKLRFWFKPRIRIWNQSGVKELVTITVPKKIERVYTDGLSQTEVKSRLHALADTIDSRGWAVKNVNLNADYMQQPFTVSPNSDRLLDISSVPSAVPDDSIPAYDDMLDQGSSPIARQFASMITQSSQEHHQQLIDQLSDNNPVAAPAAGSSWFMNQPGQAAAPVSQASRPYIPSSPAIQPTGISIRPPAQQAANRQPAQAKQPPAPAGPAPADPAILSLASNNDLNVTALAHEARREKGGEGDSSEVVISLH